MELEGTGLVRRRVFVEGNSQVAWTTSRNSSSDKLLYKFP